MSMFTVDEDLCTGCGICVESCPSGAITMRGRTAEIEAGLCTSCGTCAQDCPQGAIYEYEEVPALRGNLQPAAVSYAPGPPAPVGDWRQSLARQQKVVTAAVLLPALSKILFRLAGRPSNRAKNRTVVTGRGGGHRWRGGR